MMPISYPKYGCQILFLKPRYHQHLLKMFCTSSEVTLNLTQTHGKLLGKILYPKISLTSQISDPKKYGKHIPVYKGCKNALRQRGRGCRERWLKTTTGYVLMKILSCSASCEVIVIALIRCLCLKDQLDLRPIKCDVISMR